MPLYNHINTFNGKNYGYFVDSYENISTKYNDDYRGYLAMIIKFDKRVKEIYNKLENLNILDKTVLIITSDNGAELYYERGRPTFKDPFNSSSNKVLLIKDTACWVASASSSMLQLFLFLK